MDMKKRTNQTKKLPSDWARDNSSISISKGVVHDFDHEPSPWQQVMDRMEGRMLCYGNLAARCRGGPKQYTKSQLEDAKAKAMQEARMIVWMWRPDEDGMPALADRIDAHMAEYRERCQAGQKTEDDEEIYEDDGSPRCVLCDAFLGDNDGNCGVCGCPEESQRKAAGTADEKPDGQAENES